MVYMLYERNQYVWHQVYGHGQVRQRLISSNPSYRVKFGRRSRDIEEKDLTVKPEDTPTCNTTKINRPKFVLGETFRHIKPEYGFGVILDINFVDGQYKYRVYMLEVLDEFIDHSITLDEQNMLKLYDE